AVGEGSEHEAGGENERRPARSEADRDSQAGQDRDDRDEPCSPVRERRDVERLPPVALTKIRNSKARFTEPFVGVSDATRQEAENSEGSEEADELEAKDRLGLVEPSNEAPSTLTFALGLDHSTGPPQRSARFESGVQYALSRCSSE